MGTLLQISQCLFDSWNKSGLAYCHWKSNEHLIAGLNGETDLDVLLSSKDRIEGEALLRKLDFLLCKSQFGSRYPDVNDWIGFDRVTGRLVHLHLHYRIATGHKGLKEYSLPWVEEMLQRRILDKNTGVYVADPSIELVTLYTRIALKISLKDRRYLKKGLFRLDPSIKSEIDYLRLRVDWSLINDFVSRQYGDDASAIISILRLNELDSNALSKFRLIAEKHFMSVNRFGRANRMIEFFYKYAVKGKKIVGQHLYSYSICRKVPASERGLQVAFLGQDGSGKTTVTSDIRKWWSWKMDVRYIYLGSGDNYFSWRKALQKIVPAKGPFKIVRAWLQLSKFRHLAKNIFCKIKTGKKYASRGGLVIYDRYPQITYPGISDGPKIRSVVFSKIPSSLQRLLGFFPKQEERYLQKASAIQPDIVIKLIISPEESVRRKPENKLEDMVRKHDIIQSLSFNDSVVITIDGTMPYSEEILLIKQIIWDHISK